MFRLYDTRTGQAGHITMPPRGLLRMYVGGPPADRSARAGYLRTVLLGDLIRRNAEHRHDLAVVATLVMPGEGGGTGAEDEAHDDAFRADTAALNVRPAEQTAGASAVPGPISSHEIIVGTIRVGSAPVVFDGHQMAGVGPDGAPETAALTRLADLGERGLDPLALRLACLSVRYREQLDLSWEALGDADRELRRWRKRVAEWAELPSKPMRVEVMAQVAEAFDDDLDSPAALRALRELEQDPGIPPGSKFESFVHADQILGLDLPREIGRAG